MQLPPSDELVLASGTAPIRARKARYFEDRELKARLLPPPITAPNDGLTAMRTPGREPPEREWADIIEGPPSSEPPPKYRPPEDRANSGARREPELPSHEEVATPPTKAAQEFEPPLRAPAPTRRNIQRRFTDMARQASLDLDDDMSM